MTEKKKVSIILADNYLTAIKNSVDTKLFRNLYAEVDGQKTDIVNNGELSCALFASSILYLFGLIKSVHATVTGTIADLQNFGWVETKEPRTGCVLVWEAMDFGGENFHKHIGFYIGNDRAISNDFETGVPKEHHFQYKGRKVELILWNTKLA